MAQEAPALYESQNYHIPNSYRVVWLMEGSPEEVVAASVSRWAQA